MNLFIFHGLILFGFSMMIMPETFAFEQTWSQSQSQSMLLMEPEIQTKKCRYFRDKTMLTCNCQSLNLAKIPSNLDRNIEVLDFSFNRLVTINKDTFSRFTSLKYLDLHDNFLKKIEDSAFDPLQDLMVLDLSNTLSEKLPKGLFNLPRLEKLYIEENELTEAIFKSEVTSPLTIIQASKNSIKKFPNFGPLPTLIYFNISENHIEKININDIASYCKLKTLDLSKNPISFDDNTCDCQYFNSWIKHHNITVRPNFQCSTKLHCMEKFTNETLSLYQECEEIIKEKIKSEKAKSTWILVLSCVSGSLLCIFFILYCIHRRNKKRHRKLKKAQQLATTNANTELLNGNQEQT
ncbi:toll-like receptor 4 [Leptopilina heterotoma]|uniref:toll-like receptor 4 n=1 Tax=Leptopilina heterotoma TaxID=63436 RepID=UPI001CA7FB21|nr:toll-like receptor 4 [Leptopilina heterotoma]